MHVDTHTHKYSAVTKVNVHYTWCFPEHLRKSIYNIERNDQVSLRLINWNLAFAAKTNLLKLPTDYEKRIFKTKFDYITANF